MSRIISFLVGLFGVVVSRKILVTALFAAKWGFYISIAYFLKDIVLFFVNSIEYSNKYINDKISSGGSDLASWGFAVVSSMGIWDAFVSAFVLFGPVLSAILFIKLRKILISLISELEKYVQKALSL